MQRAEGERKREWKGGEMLDRKEEGKTSDMHTETLDKRGKRC